MADTPEPSAVDGNGEGESGDVLHRLDQLLNKHRLANESSMQVPTLTEALEQELQADIPVLLDEAALANAAQRSPQYRFSRPEITRLELRFCQMLRQHLEQAARDCPESFTIEARAEFQVSIEELLKQLPGMVHRAMLDALRDAKKI